jgi:predicted NUDIX family NTP pyrophosphohydrolase
MRRSAGILLFRRRGGGVEVLLGHMGGPIWARRDIGAWTIPKGQYAADEDPLAAAQREFAEELGLTVPNGPLLPLGDVRQSGKLVTAWAVEADLDTRAVRPGTFRMQWPPRSGSEREFPELDRVQWLDTAAAGPKIIAAQRDFLRRLATAVGADVDTCGKISSPPNALG